MKRGDLKRGDAGFTLLEILVALVVFGLVMDGIVQTLRFGLIVWGQGPARSAEPENLAAVDMALTRIIAGTLPGSVTGLADQFSFTTVLPPGAGLQSALADVAIATDNGNLILRYRPHPAGIPLTPPPAPWIETLSQGVSNLQVFYLGRQTGGHPVWSDKWKNGNLPVLVRLHIELADGRAWPDLIIAPVAAAN